MRLEAQRRLGAALLLALHGFACFSLFACDGGHARSLDEERIGYPRGPWWRADLNGTVLGVAHILIAHGQSESEPVLLAPLITRPRRTREQARERALRLSAELRAHPERFAALAASHSDDTATASLGGQIGAVYAMDLPAPLVDALGNVALGECSYPVETMSGFHVLKRVPIAPARTLGLQEIVISHADAELVRRPEHDVHRTLEEARQLAQQVAASLREDPTRFEQLARTYSDAYSGRDGGLVGAVSSLDRLAAPTSIHVLSGLDVGGTSAPLLTRQGYVVLRRHHAESAVDYGATLLAVPYRRESSLAPDAQRTRLEAESLARELLQRARSGPGSFQGLSVPDCASEVCAVSTLRVGEADRAYAGLAARLAKLSLGDLVAEPVDTPFGFVIARRERLEDTPARSALALRFELPRPAPITLDNAEPGQIIWYLEELADRIDETAALGLSADERRQVRDALYNTAASIAASDAAARGDIVAATLRELTLALGLQKAIAIAEFHERLLASLSGTITGTRPE